MVSAYLCGICCIVLNAIVVCTTNVWYSSSLPITDPAIFWGPTESCCAAATKNLAKARQYIVELFHPTTPTSVPLPMFLELEGGSRVHVIHGMVASVLRLGGLDVTTSALKTRFRALKLAGNGLWESGGSFELATIAVHYDCVIRLDSPSLLNVSCYYQVHHSLSLSLSFLVGREDDIPHVSSLPSGFPMPVGDSVGLLQLSMLDLTRLLSRSFNPVWAPSSVIPCGPTYTMW
ncbi:hypothetical protein CPB85DRAFT_1250869 [Mucidula mucida]|nr:hypothetical protein CPB85DRAFT_1250869 [Mucidula mucida]